MPLDIVRPPGVAAHQAYVLLLGGVELARLVGVVRPHVAVEVLGLGPAGLAKVAPAALGVVVYVFAV
jgi:hypothetical protein